MSILPQPGTTPDAHGISSVAQATASATGTISWTVFTGLQGSVATLTLVVPMAPTTGVFAAVIGGVTLDTWGGDSTVGPFQVLANQILTVTGSGMVPGQAYTLSYSGPNDRAPVAVVSPTPNTSALTSSIQGSFDVLAQTTLTVPGYPSDTGINGTAVHVYEGVEVTVETAVSQSFVLQVYNVTKGTTSPLIELYVVGGITTPWYYPLQANPGDALQVVIAAQSGTPATATIGFYGLTQSPNVAPTTSLPLSVVLEGGLFYASGATSTTVQLLAASPGNLFYRLQRWGVNLFVATGPDYGGVLLEDAEGEIDGEPLNMPVASGVSGGSWDLQGTLSFGPVSFTNVYQDTLTAWVRYDIVARPTIA